MRDLVLVFFCQAEDGIRCATVTGVQTCALPISLREARRRQGLELAEVARETLIRERYLAALEEERFELMPARAYAKGFLRVYADFLGLDAQLFVDAFNSRFPETELPE